MSLLLPERHQLNLFPRTSTLCIRQRKYEAATGPDGRDIATLFAAADNLLRRDNKTSYWRSPLDIILSDELICATLLPWQDRIRTYSQSLKYAQASISQVGITMVDDWTVIPLFRRYGSAGLAVAIRRDHLEQFADLCKGRPLRVRSLLPFTAVTYWSYRGVKSGENGLLFLEEPNRITALSYLGSGLQGIDVEPVVGGDAEQAIRRLLFRMLAFSSYAHIHYGAAYATSEREQLFKTLTPEASYKVLPLVKLG